MSEVRVNNIVDFGGKGAPTFDNGAVISGISSLGDQAKIGGNVTITSGGINVSGVTTATLSGNLTGDVNSGFVTATSAVIGSGVTINAGGLNITGVMTATTFEGSGASMTGVAMTITPLAYNPDVSDSTVPKTSGIGITFDHRILAGSGNVTLSIATNAGAAGTTVENFGVGSSVTIQGRKAIIDPTSDLNAGETYHISYPSGAFTNTGGDVSYVGTAYTFGVKPTVYELYSWGYNTFGALGQNDRTNRSSPVQIPGTTWNKVSTTGVGAVFGIKTDGTLWAWGSQGGNGSLGLNQPESSYVSSPTQIPGTTWASVGGFGQTFATKTDGTLWVWGGGNDGRLGLNDTISRSSPTQVPGTTWSTEMRASGYNSQNSTIAIKSDGTMWAIGNNGYGALGLNQPTSTKYSSPVQIPGTTWSSVSGGDAHYGAIKTDGTYWSWGRSYKGALGNGSTGNFSSPVQVPGTTWSKNAVIGYGQAAVKTDGTLWTWGRNNVGQLGRNTRDTSNHASPEQVPGTTWDNIHSVRDKGYIATKTDGTLWTWGEDAWGYLGNNKNPGETRYSSPVQIPGTTWTMDNNGSRRVYSSVVMFKEV